MLELIRDKVQINDKRNPTLLRQVRTLSDAFRRFPTLSDSRVRNISPQGIVAASTRRSTLSATRAFVITTNFLYKHQSSFTVEAVDAFCVSIGIVGV